MPGDTFRAVIADLKESIPARRRKWDASSRRWFLRDCEADTVLSILRAYEADFDIEDERRTSGHRGHQAPALTRVDAAATLYLLSTAPDYVVQAVFRAMAKHAHPDAGGDNEQMRRLNLAMEVLRE